MRFWPLVVCVCLFGIVSTPAYARKHRTVVLAPECNVTMPCEGGYYSDRAKKFIGIPFGAPVQNYTPQHVKKQAVPVPSRGTWDRGTVIGSRPPGCPHAYCGCGASLYLFGKIIPSLNLAANWLKFPKSDHPAPGLAAARNGHVMVLVREGSGGRWIVHDSNSGGGLTRVHESSLAGYRIVVPHS